MASFSERFPRAFHVFPLTAARGIFAARALLSKARFGSDGVARRTTREVDRALGFEDFVHLYLPRAGASFEDLPILAAQLAPSRRPAVPHAVVVLDTAALPDEDCVVCNWNIAVGRPRVEGVCRGGNWSRGTSSERIAEVWRAFKAAGPSVERARGFWVGPLVPVIPGERIAKHWRLMTKRSGIPELLLRSRVPLGRSTRVVVFSDADERSLSSLPRPSGLEVHRSTFDGYSTSVDSLGLEARQALDRYLAHGGAVPDIDFDGRRARRARASTGPARAQRRQPTARISVA